VLSSVASIQIKWLNDVPIDRTVPANAPHEVGLHIDVQPIEGVEVEWSILGKLIESYFDIHGLSEKSFISASDTLSFFAPLQDLNQFTTRLQELVCTESDSNCRAQLAELAFADSFSLSYGTLPIKAKSWQKDSDIVIEAFWNDRQKVAAGLGITESVLYKNDDIKERVEVGLLSIHPDYNQPGFTWGLTGFSRNLDEEKSEKLLFQYGSQHHPNRGTYSVDFERPTGLHPKHVISLENVFSPQARCSLFAKYTFAKSLFLDKYQLAELDKPTPSRDAVGYLHGLWGESDLEAPIWAVDGYGSEALVQIYAKNRPKSETPGTFQFELPTHSRYEVPQLNSTVVDEVQPWPVVFWACQSTEEEKEAYPAPGAVETVHLGYETIFPKNTVFHYLTPKVEAGKTLQSEFDIPVAPFSSYETVQLVTLIAILTGFFYLTYELVNRYKSTSKPAVVAGAKKQE